MLLDREVCRLECRPVVALLASIAPWLTRELALMLVAVAVDARCKLDLEFRCCARRYVTSGAAHVCMRSLQREAGLRMVRDRERRWVPALYRVTAFATAAIRTFRKLTAVRIGFVAVGALAVRNRRLKISSDMTAQALNLEVFPKQREAGL